MFHFNMRMQRPKFQKHKCQFCHEECYGIGFGNELIGGCREMKAWYEKITKEKGNHIFSKRYAKTHKATHYFGKGEDPKDDTNPPVQREETSNKKHESFQ